MSHAAKPYGPRNGGTYVEQAQNAWGGTMPEWVLALAIACDGSDSMSAVARRLDYSNAVVSSVLTNKYRGRHDRVEAKVRGIMMSAEVFCPAAGMTIARNQCADNQRRKPSSANPLTAKFPAACKRCENCFGGQNA